MGIRMIKSSMIINMYSKIINRKTSHFLWGPLFQWPLPEYIYSIHTYIQYITVYPISIDLCQIFFSKWEKEYIYIPFMPINRDKYREI